MTNKIRIGIVGYGNIGRGVEYALKKNPDMELVAVFTRREPGSFATLDPQTKVLKVSEAPNFKDQIDVMLLCGGSATDLPEQGPHFAKMFNTVDSYDNHSQIPRYFAAMDQAAREGGNLSLISIGWDPGLFSLNRMIAEAILPDGRSYTFWGKGVSQGHSDAVRRVKGVKNAVQYTIPLDSALEKVRKGEYPEFTPREMHRRQCFVAAEEGADKAQIEHDIKTMPGYFEPYDTEVIFITEEELKANHSAMPHGGFVIRSGQTAEGNNHIMEFSLKLDSNPQFTSSVLVAYARAAYRLHREGQVGAKTVFDVPPGYLSPKSPEELRKNLL